ncbi:hypothetical protein PSTG_12251 [Puccinia striiformis f. sp. tritici PST-78]|uniref:S1 motif domain-containing protein n=1 Tax=Puccinia striiformis f. sp. tritici PST-78 TaxID=1165861 RepID=A0A0L0V5Q8_9BASI|nr:hypothetical protein PSTG_12251 [Puccinia striiformis f. sp. tritici PST-78]
MNRVSSQLTAHFLQYFNRKGWNIGGSNKKTRRGGLEDVLYCTNGQLPKELSHTINLHPSFFGPRTAKFLDEKLSRDVEGTCTGRFGYIIAVLSTLDVSAGTIQPGTGMAEFVIKYSAIVLKPFKGEVVDGIVGQVNKMGFFVEVGPLQAFVSSHLIPSDLKFDPNANPPCFSSDEDQATIEKGTRIRLKIVGTRVDATEIFAIGTIKVCSCSLTSCYVSRTNSQPSFILFYIANLLRRTILDLSIE